MSQRDRKPPRASRRAALSIGAVGIAFATLLLRVLPAYAAPAGDGTPDQAIPILAYHRFAPTVTDSMTVTTATFEGHLQYLADNGYTVIPLRRLVDAWRGVAPPVPPHSVVITVDDGHRSVYGVMYPLVRRFAVPVTAFIYPSAISRADYALTWVQLRELRASGLFDIQSHTYWHPNFHTEKHRLTPDEYTAFVTLQLERSRAILERELGEPVALLSWPFGIYDADLVALARRAGYVAAVTIDGRPARPRDDLMALPRFLMTERLAGRAFGRLLEATSR